MSNSTNVRRTAVAVAASISICSALALAQPAFGQTAVAIVVNGAQMQFQQPPIERAGRVFVPLRGVFEHLGASVVYDDGTINATGNGRNVSLRIGSNQATVNGQTQTLDEAPFLLGSSTLVPLRFIAQALGATVDWNNDSSTVTITGGNSSGVNRDSARNRENSQSFYLSNETPNRSSRTENPAIHATYSEPISRESLRVSIDGRDITRNVYANATGFNVTPSFALNSGMHQVTVTGTTQAGNRFSTGWTFQIQ
ncbi:MAG: copper amine oxidase N-terminal domain-containing protein [Candidatus Aquilonibacter sp.]